MLELLTNSTANYDYAVKVITDATGFQIRLCN